MIDTDATDLAIEQNRHRSVQRQTGQQSGETRLRFGQVVQHTDAIDEVKLAQAHRGHVQQIALNEFDALQSTPLRACACNVDGSSAQVKMYQTRADNAAFS